MLENICSKFFPPDESEKCCYRFLLRSIKNKNDLSSQIPFEEIDCTVRANALKVLGLSEQQLQDQTILNRRYQDLIQEYSRRIKRVQTTNPLYLHFEKVINITRIAYNTLQDPQAPIHQNKTSAHALAEID